MSIEDRNRMAELEARIAALELDRPYQEYLARLADLEEKVGVIFGQVRPDDARTLKLKKNA